MISERILLSVILSINNLNNVKYYYKDKKKKHKKESSKLNKIEKEQNDIIEPEIVEVEEEPKVLYQPVTFDPDLVFANTEINASTYIGFNNYYINIDILYDYNNYENEYVVTVFRFSEFIDQDVVRVFRMFKPNEGSDTMMTSGNRCGIVILGDDIIEFYGIDRYSGTYIMKK